MKRARGGGASSRQSEPNGLDARALVEIRLYRRRASMLLLGGLGLLVAFVVAASVVEGRADSLVRTGIHVPGRVTDVRGAGEGGSIVIEFGWEGQLRRHTVHLDASSPRYSNGQQVDVVVDRSDPQHVSVPGETNQSSLTTFPMLVACVAGGGCIIVAAWALVRSRRQRRLLSLRPWRRMPCQYAELRGGNAVRPVLVAGEGEGLLLTLASIPRWRLSRTGLRGTTSIEVAGDTAGYVVVRGPERGPLLSAHPPRTAAAERRWRRAMS